MAASEPKALFIHKVRDGSVIYNLDGGVYRVSADVVPWLQAQSQTGFLWPYSFRRVLAVLEQTGSKDYLILIEEIPEWVPKRKSPPNS